jgi:hypothetical protein
MLTAVSLLARKEVVGSSVGDKSTVCADMSYARRVALHEQRRRPGAIPYRIGEGRKDDRGGLFRIVNALCVE